ncbi:MAG: glycosyltransferase [Bacteroidetes bacterium]|nr:glycosyltransferase [Bacteroidota bacterium]
MLEEIFLSLLIISLFGMTALQFFIWKGLASLQSPQNEKLHQFSVIIAARNEEEHIGSCLHSLVTQNYPKELFEIIVANDRSTDRTAEIISEFCAEFSNVRTITITGLRPGYFPKKNALTSAIEIARNEILAFTDADCIASPNWLKTLSSYYAEEVGVVTGRCINDTSKISSLFGKLFYTYENLKVSLSTAAAIGMQSAYTGKGGNFSYRKIVYNEVGGFSAINRSVSGDDDLFIQLIQQKTDWKIQYMKEEGSETVTNPPLKLKNFIKQRRRHISASKYYALKFKIVFGISHAFTFLSLLGLFIIPLYALIAILIRINIDAVILFRYPEFIRAKLKWTDIFIGELLLLFYTVCIGPIGFTKSISWKEAS